MTTAVSTTTTSASTTASSTHLKAAVASAIPSIGGVLLGVVAFVTGHFNAPMEGVAAAATASGPALFVAHLVTWLKKYGPEIVEDIEKVSQTVQPMVDEHPVIKDRLTAVEHDVDSWLTGAETTVKTWAKEALPGVDVDALAAKMLPDLKDAVLAQMLQPAQAREAVEPSTSAAVVTEPPAAAEPASAVPQPAPATAETPLPPPPAPAQASSELKVPTS